MIKEKEITKTNIYADTVHSSVKFRTNKQDEFIQVYLRMIPNLWQLTKAEYDILTFLWLQSSYSNEFRVNTIHNSAILKDRIRKVGISVSNSTIDNSFNKLTKYGALIRECKGAYKLNPKWFFRGNIGKIVEGASVTLEYVNPDVDKDKKDILEDNKVVLGDIDFEDICETTQYLRDKMPY